MPGGILGFTPSGVPYGGGVGLTLVPAAELPQVVAQLEASTINPGPFASAVDFVETIAKGIAAGAAGAALGYVAVTAASAAVTAAEGVGTVAAADATAGLAATEAAAAEVAAASALTAAPSASLPAVVTSTLQRLATSLTSSYLAQALRPKPAAPAAPQVFLLAPSGGRIMDDYDYIPDASGAFDLPSIDWRQLSDSALQVLVNRNANQSSGPTAQLVIPSLPGGMQQTGLGALAGRGLASLGLAGLGGAAAVAVGVLRTVGGRILGWILPSGAKISRPAAVSLAKQMGLATAAGAIGATIQDLAEAVMQESAHPRRRRGISASSLRVTKRTIGQLERAHKQISRAARAHAGR